jgi:hypothetical protein
MLAFFDTAGGGLATLAASIAKHRGLEASASTIALAPREEVSAALAEIGVLPLEAREVGAAPAGAIVVGAGGEITARLYDGPAETAFGDTSLERIALARIARDTLERWLEQRG